MKTDPDPTIALSRGLAVFGLPAGERRALPGWQGHCIRTVDELALRWRPGDNLGIGCRESNVVGVDLDRKDGKDGVAELDRLAAAAGAGWPDTLTVATPNNGLHLYFRMPAGIAVPSTTGKIGPGIDVRAPGRRQGGYLIGPDSVVGGRRYTIEHDVAAAILPGWLARLVRAGRRPATSKLPGWTTSPGSFAK
jgi:hypothetical protein